MRGKLQVQLSYGGGAKTTRDTAWIDGHHDTLTFSNVTEYPSELTFSYQPIDC